VEPLGGLKYGRRPGWEGAGDSAADPPQTPMLVHGWIPNSSHTNCFLSMRIGLCQTGWVIVPAIGDRNRLIRDVRHSLEPLPGRDAPASRRPAS
jgi:hypothetical protein